MAYVNNNIVNLNGNIDYDDAVREIASLLGVGTRSDGKYHLSDLCVSSRINMWSKHKPVRSSDTANTGTTYLANDGWCGIDTSSCLVSSRGDLSAIASKMTSDGLNGWKHAKPRGNVVSPTEWNRLMDFHLYYHNASKFVQKLTAPESWAKQGGTIFNASCMYVEQADMYNLSQHDLPIKNYYFGLCLINGDSLYRMTNDKTIAEAGFTIAFDVANVPIGDYTIYPFMSSMIMSVTDSDVIPAAVYTVPNTTPRAISIVQSAFNLEASGTYNILLTQLSYRIVITNGGGSSRVMSANKVMLRYSDNVWYSPLVTGEVEVAIADFTLAAGETREFTGTITGFASDLPAQSKLVASFGTGTFHVESSLRLPARPTNL